MNPMVTRQVPAWSRVAFAVGKVTMMEILRDKILYNVLLCGFLLFGIGALGSKLNSLRPERLILDMGVASVILSCSAIAIFFGAGTIGREFDRRTTHVVFSRPISKGQFIVGKFAGISAVLVANWALLSLAFLANLAIFRGSDSAFGNSAIFPALLLALFQSFIMAAVSMFLSTFSTTSMSVAMAIGVYLVGENISALRAVVGQVGSSSLKRVLELLVSLPPDLEYFNLGLRVTYGLPIGAILVLKSVIYAIFLTSAFVIAASFAIRRKEV